MFIENKRMFYENMFKKEICFAYCLIMTVRQCYLRGWIIEDHKTVNM